MFTEFKREKGPLYKQRVNTLVGSIFLGTCALWAAMFVWNVTTGGNPISRTIAAAVQGQTIVP